MTAPGGGPIVGLPYASAVDDPGRFRSSKVGGAQFGDPKKYQAGETDVPGRISKIGDGGVRTALDAAANVIVTRPVQGSTLKSWEMRLAARAGMRKAKVALARTLAVGLHRMLANGTTFLADKAAPAAAPSQEEIPGSGGSRRRPPGARSRRRDDGPGQTDDISAGQCHCAVQIGRLFLIRPHQGGPAPTPARRETPGDRIKAQRD